MTDCNSATIFPSSLNRPTSCNASRLSEALKAPARRHVKRKHPYIMPPAPTRPDGVYF